MKYLKWMSIVGGMFLLLTTCKDPECPKLMPNSAQFKMYSFLEYFDQVNGEAKAIYEAIEEDTMVVNSVVTFEATDPRAQTYSWIIGGDDRPRTDKKLEIRFSEEALEGDRQLEITLITTRKPDKDCFPNDDGIDTLKKTLTILPYRELAIFGKFYGSDNNDPNKKYTVEVVEELIPAQGYFWIKGMIPECSNGTRADFYGGFTAFNFSIDNFRYGIDFPNPTCEFAEFEKKIGRLSSDRNRITIEYAYYNSSNPQTIYKRIFTGTRVP